MGLSRRSVISLLVVGSFPTVLSAPCISESHVSQVFSFIYRKICNILVPKQNKPQTQNKRLNHGVLFCLPEDLTRSL